MRTVRTSSRREAGSHGRRGVSAAAPPRDRARSPSPGEADDARPLLRAMDAGRPDPAPAAPDGDRDRQSADLDADPQSAAAPPRRDLCGSDRVRADRRQRHLHLRACWSGCRSATRRSARWSPISATTRCGCPSRCSSATRCAPRPRWSASRIQQFAARGRHRHLRAPHVQPARRAGLRDGADGADAEAGGHEAALAPVRARRPAGPDGEGARRGRGRADPRSRGCGGAGRQGGGAAGGRRTSSTPTARRRLWVRVNPLDGPEHREGSGRDPARASGRHRAAQGRRRRLGRRAGPAPDRARQRHRRDPRHRHRDAGGDLRARHLWRRASGSPA